ncbi:Thiosulfate sulfurtransferase RDL2, mitochondrial [Lachnellula occidentalis]|uniref:Thiosulfate sulfurtransferase RDL2, mitochondrial n=1 Tax=Lachnellula occidentalis TaxID=215460 RepID=A0A8H8S4Q0_9HELO|nr:Thiosulfate sulfurtransferase RDL2, mitochondrial [Lachnellula occidentalis]
MSTPRIATSFLLRASRSSVVSAPRQFRAFPLPTSRATPLAIRSQFRSYSQDSPPQSKIYAFEDVQKLSTNPSPSRILIDTREPGELQSSGTIPGALNIPVVSQADSWFVTPEEFEDRYGFERPGKDVEVVFFCKAGVRSKAAAELARQAGWGKVGEYKGSWLDWEGKGGKIEGGRS